MNAKELAKKLNGCEYGEEIDRSTELAAKLDGLVVVFGGSDDLMEFRGAIHDVVGAWEGASVFLDAKGLMREFNDLCEDKDFQGLQDYFERFEGRREIEAVWDSEGYSWTYKTTIPHVCFDVLEDGEPYCRGIVFQLSDATAKDSP